MTSRPRPIDTLAALVAGGRTIIDAHAHVGTWEREPWDGLGADWAATVALMRSCGISAAVVFPTGPTKNGAALDAIQAGPAFPTWLFPWVTPGVPQSVAFVERHAELVSGLKLHPSFDLCRVTDPEMEPILRLAARHGWIVQVHCGRWQEWASYRLVLDAAERHPDVPFVLAHMGGDAPELKLAAVDGLHERGLTNAWIELSCTREHWVIRRAVDQHGWDRLLYGSDHCMHHPLSVMAALVGAGLPDEALGAILGGNVLALLGDRPLLHGP